MTSRNGSHEEGPSSPANSGQPEEPAARRRRLFKTCLRLALTVLLIGLILRSVSPRDLLRAIAGATPTPLVLGLLAGAVFTTLKVVRWWWFLSRMKVECSSAEAFYSYLGGMSVGLLTPGRLGEVARSLYLKNVNRSYAGGLALLDKLFDVLVIVIAAAIGCAVHGLFESAILLLLLGSGGILVGVLLRSTSILNGIAERVPFRLVRRVLQQFVVALGHASPRVMISAIGQAILAFSVTILQFWLFLVAFGPAPWRAAAFAMPLMVLSNLIPLTISGVGIREWAAIIFLSQYAIPDAVAVNVALLVFITNTLGPGLTGALLAPRFKALDGSHVLEVVPPCGPS